MGILVFEGLVMIIFLALISSGLSAGDGFSVSAMLLLTALMLLSLCVILGGRSDTFLSKVLLESLLIGGWVFTWEAIHMLFLDIIEPFHRSRELRRFIKAKLFFRYLGR